MRSDLVLGTLAVALAAEVLASVAVWHGTPTDWPGEGLHFWQFELLRLGYWSFCCGLAGVGLCASHKIAGLRLSNRQSLALFCSLFLGVEAATSLLFWKGLTLPQVGYLGWPDYQRYILDHLISWVVSVALVGLSAWLLMRRWVGQTSQSGARDL
jgi:hypothetical protein